MWTVTKTYRAPLYLYQSALVRNKELEYTLERYLILQDFPNKAAMCRVAHVCLGTIGYCTLVPLEFHGHRDHVRKVVVCVCACTPHVLPGSLQHTGSVADPGSQTAA